MERQTRNVRLCASRITLTRASGVIWGGRIPRGETGVQGVGQGGRGGVILNGRRPHAVLVELFTDGGAGTLTRP